MSATITPASRVAPAVGLYAGGAFDSLDSFEGVPEMPDWFAPRVPVESRHPAQRMAHEALAWAGAVLPGVAMAAVLAVAGAAVSRWLGSAVFGLADSPVSPILVAVLLGLLVRNIVGVPAAYEQGLKLCIKTVLRVGIVLLGLRLSLAATGGTALIALPIIVACIAVALLAVTWVGGALGLPRRLGALIAVGTSICGVSAIVAAAPAVDAEDDEVSYAVGCVTLFGMLALFTYPFLSHWLFAGDPVLAGLFLGTSIHDTAQVAGAGLMYQQQYGGHAALDGAVVTKLVRNVCMAGVIPLVAVLYHRGSATAADARRTPWQRWHNVIPLFVIGFLAMVVLGTIGDWSQRRYGVPDPDAWARTLHSVKELAAWLLAAAMAAVGLGTGLAKLRGLGWKPLTLGFAAAALVGAVSAALVTILGPLSR